MARDDDGRLPRRGANFPSDWRNVVIPDDARELDAEARALRRERRAQARGDLLRRIFLQRSRAGISIPILIVIVLVAVGFATFALLMPSANVEGARSSALASGARPVGTEGGLLPELVINRDDGTQLSLRAQRPAVIVLLPNNCDCKQQVDQVAESADRQHIKTVFIGDVSGNSEDLPKNGVLKATDPSGSLGGTYQLGSNPLVLLVRSDGIVNRILTEEPPQDALTAELTALTNGS